MQTITVERSDALLEKAVAAWSIKIDALIRTKFDDAAAHAQKAVTDSLRRAPDGRPTLRKSSKSPSFLAAVARLDELKTALVGPSKDSLQGALRRARADFYRRAFVWVQPYLRDGVHRLDGGPTAAGEDVARGAVVHGLGLDAELSGPFGSAVASLTAAVNLAAGRDASLNAASLLIGDWRDRQSRAVSNRCVSALYDSARAFLWAVEQALVLPS